MSFICDLHLHSHYSIATSKNLNLEHLHYWARLKGITVLGTGDCVHPAWSLELKEKLIPCDNGLYRLHKKYWLKEDRSLAHPNIEDDIYFILTGEISSIYKKSGRVRKVHNLCVFDSFASLTRLQSRLDSLGNIRSDGRPILGLDARDLLELVLESSSFSYLIPAHIWTPWFSLFGSRSGFDTVEECFGDLSSYIFALETGLSSDPLMNRLCSMLDKYNLVSSSDAHSPDKLAREATIFLDSSLSYKGIYNALKNKDRGLVGTIEFFPQEGKYYFDGHRKCGVCYDPLETKRRDGICRVCGNLVTRGVMSRILELADRFVDREKAILLEDFYSLTSLSSILAELMGLKGLRGKRITREYFRLISLFGSELYILLYMEELSLLDGEFGGRLRLGIERLRNKELYFKEGFDGQFGRVSLFGDER